MINSKMRMLFVLGTVAASGMATGLAAQDSAGEKASSQVVLAIETTDSATEATQALMTVIRLRYNRIESLESVLRRAESEETDLRGAIAQNAARMETLNAAARAELEAVQRGLAVRASALLDRKNTTRGQVFLERHEVEKLEAVILRACAQPSPPS